MNRHQKIAWFTLIMLALALFLSLIAVGVLHLGYGLPMHRAVGGFGFIGVIGFCGLAPLIFRKGKQDKLDERDLLILRKVKLTAYWCFWPVFVLAAMAPFFIYGPDGTVSVKYLCWMVFGGMFFVMLMEALVTLEEYGWGNKENE